jgi:hypothetical protein
VIVQDMSLARFLRRDVAAALDPAKPIEAVSLYIARSAGDLFSEVRIGAVPHGPLTDKLRSFPLPQGSGNLISIRQFIVAKRAAARPEPPWLGLLQRVTRWFKSWRR